jgi:hypothetical protein
LFGFNSWLFRSVINKNINYQIFYYYYLIILFKYSHRQHLTQPIIELSVEEQEDQINCHASMMYTMSTFEDWRTNLAQLLQSVPFPDKALTNDKFIKYIYTYTV